MNILLDAIPVMLAIIVLFLALMQEENDRFVVACIFAACGISHMMMFGVWQFVLGNDIDGITYFVTAAIMSGVAAELILKYPGTTNIAVTLVVISWVEIIANVIGLFFWYNGFSPLVNFFAFIAIRMWVIIALIRNNADDTGRLQVNSRADYLRHFASASFLNHQANKAEK